MVSRSFRALGLAASLIAVAVAAAPAAALTINLNADSSFTQSPNGAAALLGFQKAANYWTSVLTNDVTLNFSLHFDNLGANVLGGTYSNTVYNSVSDVYGGLAATGNSQIDSIAVSHLRPLSVAGGIAYRTPGISGGVTSVDVGSRLDNNNTLNNLYMNTNTAISKAIGLQTTYADGLFQFYNDTYGTAFDVNADADITFSSTFAFDYDPSDGIATGKYDFVGVAIHEMGHALGFVSGLDDYDYTIGEMTLLDVENTPVLTTLDLFRYGSNNPTATGRDLQLDPGRGAFFSIDGQLPFSFNSNLADASSSFFATGSNYGDGGQGSHWQDSNAILLASGCYINARQVGIMDPTASACGLGVITANDMAAFDAMGWNTNVDALNNRSYAMDSADVFALEIAPVPEPGEWAMMIAGLGVVGAVARKRRPANA